MLYKNGLTELNALMKEIDSGNIKKEWEAEQKDWENLVKQVERCSKSGLIDAVQELEI